VIQAVTAPISLYLDEHVPSAVAKGLRRRGIDVKTARDAGLLGAEDKEHLDFAVAEQRAVVTQDADFLRAAQAGVTHLGIVYAPMGTPVGILVNDLTLICHCSEPSEMTDNVIYVPL
jgi:hypothetical protein